MKSFKRCPPPSLVASASHTNMQPAEEIKDASIVIPRSMISSVLLNGSLGLAMTIAVLFCLGDLDAALETPTSFPIMEIVQSATSSVSGGTGLVSC